MHYSNKIHLLPIITIPALLFSLSILRSQAQNDMLDTSGISIKEQPYYYSLRKALHHSKKVYKLNLANNSLKEFPMDILKLKELRFLILDSNQISTIPSQISELQKLQVLTLSHNHLETIPSTISKLSDLYFLDLDNNQLDNFPPHLFRIYNLEYLYIGNNKIQDLPPDIRNLSELRVLAASSNEFESIPIEIGHLYNLKKLSLSNNNLNDLPETFFVLTNLEYLYLSGNQFAKLPSGIKNFKKLEILDLAHNKLETLPSELGDLFQLKRLYIENNELENLPPDLGDLFSLAVLDISDNPIKNIPSELSRLIDLKTLYTENISFDPFPQVLYDIQNNGTKIKGLITKELYNVKLLMSQARNKKITENYKEAIIKYNEVLELDTNNAQAMSELAFSYLNNGNYDSAVNVCKRVLKKDAPPELISEVRTIYSNSLSRTNKYDNVINSYLSKIKKKPDDALPYFELGKYYYDQIKFKDASSAFQKAVIIDPYHSNSHFYLAIVTHILEQKATSIFATLWFLTIEPTDQRAKTIMPFLFTKMNMKTGIEHKGGRTSYHDSYIIRDENNEIVYKSENPTTDLLIAMLMDITKSNIVMDDTLKNDTILNEVIQLALHINKNNIEIFKAELNKICNTKMEERQEDEEFFRNYYLPYFKSLIKNRHLETFAYIINNIRREEKYITKWLISNTDKVNKFTLWSENYKWNAE